MKQTKYPIHPNFKKWANMNPPLHKAALPAMQKHMGLLFTRERSTADVTVERKDIPVGGGTIRALWYCPKDVGNHAPCLVYYHGGGFVLPAAYIETAEFDCLRDGGILYAERLREFGVPAELHNTKGTMHGFDIVLDSPIVRGCVDRRIAFLEKVFS